MRSIAELIASALKLDSPQWTSLIWAIRSGVVAIDTWASFRGAAYDSLRAAMTDTVAHALVRNLREVPLFSSFDDPGLLQLVGISVNLCWCGGSTVFEQGSEAEGLYVVLSGGVRIEEEREGARDVIAHLGPGAFFGELSLLDRRNHSRSAVTDDDTMLMVIPRESFLELLDEHENLAEAVRRTVEERRTPVADKA